MHKVCFSLTLSPLHIYDMCVIKPWAGNQFPTLFQADRTCACAQKISVNVAAAAYSYSYSCYCTITNPQSLSLNLLPAKYIREEGQKYSYPEVYILFLRRYRPLKTRSILREEKITLVLVWFGYINCLSNYSGENHPSLITPSRKDEGDRPAYRQGNDHG